MNTNYPVEYMLHSINKQDCTHYLMREHIYEIHAIGASRLEERPYQFVVQKF